ncbi:hypothetical protein CPC197_0509B, partial [Chlamydia psittaci C1/97]
FLWTFVYQPN